jgi:ribonuclease HII
MLQINYSSLLLEAGTDEAGRGCLAGPVTAAAIIFSQWISKCRLNDSKQLSEKVREQLKPILESEAVSFAVTHLYPAEIDEINIFERFNESNARVNFKAIAFTRIYYWRQQKLNAKLGLKALLEKIHRR